MAQTPDDFATLLALLDDFRPEGRPTATGESNDLSEILLNPESIPHDIENNGDTHMEDSAISLSANMSPLEDDDDEDGPRPLVSGEPGPSSDTTPPSISNSAVIAGGAASTASVTTALRTESNGARRQTRRSMHMISVFEEDAGAESDGSLPSLQSVSDSSDEEDVSYNSESESDWETDVYESSDGSDEETHLLAQLLEEAERTSAAADAVPSANSHSTIHRLEEIHTPALRTTLPYRELLERARGLLPDLDARLQPPPEWMLDLVSRMSGVDNDPKRAETLLSAMEVVPEYLVRRYEKLRTGCGEDVDGCAICRDDLVDSTAMAVEDSTTLAMFCHLPFSHEPDHIVAFPCAGKHLFHRDCLSPWLARKTTCPACRFDIDPLSLTLQASSGADVQPPSRTWQPPEAESLAEWLVAEEEAQTSGTSRERKVSMPTYPPPPLPRPAPAAPASAAPPRPARPAGASFFELFPDWALEGTWGDGVDTPLDVRLQRLSTMVRHQSQLYPRPPSAPPVPPSQASPVMDRIGSQSPPPLPFLERSVSPAPSASPPPLDVSDAIWSQFDRMSEQAERNLFPGGSPWALPHDALPRANRRAATDPVAQLHEAPLVLTPPPYGLEVGILSTDQEDRNTDRESISTFTPFHNGAASRPDHADPDGALQHSLPAFPMHGPLSNMATAYMQLARANMALARARIGQELERSQPQTSITHTHSQTATTTTTTTVTHTTHSPSRDVPQPAPTPVATQAHRLSTVTEEPPAEHQYNPADDLD